MKVSTRDSSPRSPDRKKGQQRESRREWCMRAFVLLTLASLGACTVETSGRDEAAESAVESCMLCHNGSKTSDYAGPGIENPHPFPDADDLTCTACHGGDPTGEGKSDSHVPPPPEIGDRENWVTNRQAYFNRLTMTGIDKFPDYEVDGVTYQSLDYLQFINPSDLRVVNDGRACGECHVDHVETVTKSPLATTTGILSGALYAIGAANQVNGDLYEDTAADLGFRDVSTTQPLSEVGSVSQLAEFPVFSVRNANGPNDIHNNPIYDSDQLEDDVDPVTKQVITNSPLANLYHEQVAFTCGDCHLGSAGANNRYGDFRSSGCAACHMPYALSGRSGHNDPNVPRDEPLDPDDIDEPELPHLRRHMIISTHKTLPSGEQIKGIDDYACAGCHQGSNRTVMQYWGIRLDQNEDLHNRVSSTRAMPKGGSHTNTHDDERLFDPVVE